MYGIPHCRNLGGSPRQIEIKKFIEKLQTNKAAKHGTLPAECYKNSRAVFLEHFCNMIKQLREKKQIPLSWNEGVKTLCLAAITLLNFSFKILPFMVLK